MERNIYYPPRHLCDFITNTFSKFVDLNVRNSLKETLTVIYADAGRLSVSPPRVSQLYVKNWTMWMYGGLCTWQIKSSLFSLKFIHVEL